MGGYPSTSVIEEAMRILESDGAEILGSRPSSNLVESDMPDISAIDLGESFAPVSRGKTESPRKTQKNTPSKRVSSRDQQLEEVAKKLIAIGQQLLETITAGATTCGTIGTNMAGPQKDPMKINKRDKKLKRKGLRKLSNGYLKLNTEA